MSKLFCIHNKCSTRSAQQIGLPYVVISSRHGLIAAVAEVVWFHLVERHDSVESAKRRVGGQGRARQSILVCKMVSRVGSAHGCFEFCSNYYKNSENTHKKKIQASRQFCLKLGRKTWRLLNSARMSEKANNKTSHLASVLLSFFYYIFMALNNC